LIRENNNLKEEINQLNYEINQYKELIKENDDLQEKIKRLNDEIKNSQNLEKKIKFLENLLEQKIYELQNIKPYVMTPIKPGEKKINIAFNTMQMQELNNYKLECKNVDIFMNLEEILHKRFPELKGYNKYYTVDTREIKKYLTLEQNNIKDNDIINIFLNKKNK
jgi:predicted RNase H-like nuclease (RuvC/YqgF family)